ncbi:MAG: transglycosylase domain-containing protein [Firmicutes bacterium]|nr:transglycosylase domain-containing protein [Bacillota bacterium]
MQDTKQVNLRQEAAALTQPSPPRRPNRRVHFPRPGWVIGGVAALCAATVLGLFAFLALSPLPPAPSLNPTRLYDHNGQPIATLAQEDGTQEIVSLTAISPALRQATVAAEDRHFYQHHGFDLRGLARALWTDLRAGRVVEGGSSITQQLAKNLYLGQQRTVGRKLREALLTIQLELKLSKDEILQDYLNTVYYGHGRYGAAAAAQAYFHRDVASLSLGQAAFLGGLPRAPSLYDPADPAGFARAKERQKYVLDRMRSDGYITLPQEQQALQEPAAPLNPPPATLDLPYVVDAVSAELQSPTSGYPLDPWQADAGGLAVYTTIDSNLQKAAEKAVATWWPKAVAEDSATHGTDLQMAVITLNPHNGAILAMVGGHDYRYDHRNWTQIGRQPGSTMKPMVTAYLLSHGATPLTRLESQDLLQLPQWAPQETHFQNAWGYGLGPITLRQALAFSDNTYFLQSMVKDGPDEPKAVAAFLQQTFGLGKNPGDQPLPPVPTLTLGSVDLTPLSMARAYAVLANGGQLVSPYLIDDVQTPQGVSLGKHQPQAHEQLDPAVAALTTDMLRSVFRPAGTPELTYPGDADHPASPRGGTAATIGPQLAAYPVAGKTGSTDWSSWMVGYTPQLVCAVFVGRMGSYQTQNTFEDKQHVAMHVFADVLSSVPVVSQSSFSLPAQLTQAVVDPLSGELATNRCPVYYTEHFLAGTAPTVYCQLHPEGFHWPWQPIGPQGEASPPTAQQPQSPRSGPGGLGRWWNGLFGR